MGRPRPEHGKECKEGAHHPDGSSVALHPPYSWRVADADGRQVLLVSDNVWERHKEEIARVAPQVVPLVYRGDQPFPDDVLATVDIAYFSADCWPDRSRGIVLSILKSPNLKWLQTFSAGVDSQFFVDLMARGVTLTTASGAAASPIAQTVVLYMLALSRDMRQWMRKQDRREWRQQRWDELDGASLAVVGMGPIGAEVVRLATALNMDVQAVRRTPTGDEGCPAFPMSQLHDVLSRADWVVCALPLNEDTRQVFGTAAFGAMPKGARFVNVGRGELVDEDALLAALRSGHISGAALDVFSTEPLPADSPLWGMENVIITPHNSATSTSTGARSERIFLDNLRAWAGGGQMRNVAN